MGFLGGDAAPYAWGKAGMKFMLREIRQVKFWEDFYEKAAEKRIPFKASFELTYRCNLRCRHCYIPRRQKSEELSYSEVCSALDQLADLGCFHLNLTGGELFTRSDILKIFTYAKRKGFYTIVLTNATLITPRIADQLKSLGINRVDVSLYGMTPESYEAVTQVPGSFDHCLHAIESLHQIDMPICLKMTVTNLNIDEFSEVKQFAKDLGVRFQWGYLIHPRIDGSKEPLRYRISPEAAIDLELRCQPRLFENEKNPKKKKEPSVKKNGFFYCDAGKNSLAISPYGEMNLCLEYRFPQYDLRRGTVAQGWKELVNYVKSTKPTSTYQCANCELKEFCQWCPAVGWLEKGDRGACSPYYKELAMMKREMAKEWTP